MNEPEHSPLPGPLPPVWTWSDPVALLEETWAAGGIVAIPTESSFGLAVDPADPVAVDRVLRVKGRPDGKPLPVVAGSVAALESLGAELDAPWLAPVLEAWPAPLTAVIPLARELPATLGKATLAARIPDHPRLCAVLEALERAVTATSANRSGEAAITELNEVRRLLAGQPAVVIDDGPLAGGAPSTIVGNRDGRLAVLREGRFPRSRLSGDRERGG